MPLYELERISTGEVWEEFCSYSKLEELLQDSDIKQVLCAPAIISGVSGITHKTDSGFNDMLSRIAAANPSSALAQTHGDKGIKASKIRDVTNKAKKRAGGSLL